MNSGRRKQGEDLWGVILIGGVAAVATPESKHPYSQNHSSYYDH